LSSSDEANEHRTNTKANQVKTSREQRQRKTAYAVRKQRRQRIAVVEELTAYAVDVASNNAAKNVHLFKANYCRLECRKA
jgi:hypothetical protein